MKAKHILVLGTVFGLLGVILGAFGAHWLRSAVEQWGLDASEQQKRLENWEVGVRYQMYHAFALLVVGLLMLRRDTKSLKFAAAAFGLGIAIFSGCLYAYVFTGVKTFGMIVPLGGMSQIIGWLSLLVAVLGVEDGGPDE